jgi:transcription termination factor NusB
MISRNLAHELMFKSLYQYLFYKDYQPPIAPLTFYYWNFSNKEKEYIDNYNNIIANIDNYILKITPYLKNWVFDRLPRVDQVLLLLGCGQYYYYKMPKPVAINVIVKLAKRFSASSTSYKFINATLDKML